MPYINPTWWDDESPTIRDLAPLAIADIAVLDAAHQPAYETYGGKGGYVVSPYAGFVGQRLSQLMAQWQNDVRVDCVFEDQIGARAWRRDFNAAPPGPLAYSEGWLAHTRTYSSQCLMTEMGWDRQGPDVPARPFALYDEPGYESAHLESCLWQYAVL